MSNYRTPGVYVEEIPTLAPSAAQVDTAIPAFIGYTQKANKGGKKVKGQAIYVTSLLEFQEIFGRDHNLGKVEVSIEGGHVEKVSVEKEYYMYSSVRMFFDNGGGECYVVSVGGYEDDIEAGPLLDGLKVLEKEDHPTMILVPDACLLENSTDCYDIQQKVLMHCNRMQDRVGILDVYDGHINRKDRDVVLEFRNGIGINNLSYGAAYYPWVLSNYKYKFDFENIFFKDSDGKEMALDMVMPGTDIPAQILTAIKDKKKLAKFVQAPFGKKGGIKEQLAGLEAAKKGTAEEVGHYLAVVGDIAKGFLKLADDGFDNPNVNNQMVLHTGSTSELAQTLSLGAGVEAALGLKGLSGDAAFKKYQLDKVTPNERVAGMENEKSKIGAAVEIVLGAINSIDLFLNIVLADFEEIKDKTEKLLINSNGTYKSVVNAIQKAAGVIPPGGAMAGVYAQVDSDAGVWKAPANVSVTSVVGPCFKMDDFEQENLNVDPNTGKSVNAIRSFSGKGTIVWGARTLAGNDNEWRYISVRRFFNMVEKSLQLATQFAVFEPNTATTWSRVKAVCDNFLIGQWQAGALAGSNPGQAFFVNVGLGTTMTPQDILEGRMIVEIGMAAVRPAEFIILKFSHKLQEA